MLSTRRWPPGRAAGDSWLRPGGFIELAELDVPDVDEVRRVSGDAGFRSHDEDSLLELGEYDRCLDRSQEFLRSRRMRARHRGLEEEANAARGVIDHLASVGCEIIDHLQREEQAAARRWRRAARVRVLRRHDALGEKLEVRWRAAEELGAGRMRLALARCAFLRARHPRVFGHGVTLPAPAHPPAASNGSTSNGSASNGSASNGSASIGSILNGSASNGSASNGSVSNGHGATPGGSGPGS